MPVKTPPPQTRLRLAPSATVPHQADDWDGGVGVGVSVGVGVGVGVGVAEAAGAGMPLLGFTQAPDAEMLSQHCPTAAPTTAFG